MKLTAKQVFDAVSEQVYTGKDFPETWVDGDINFEELAKSLNAALASPTVEQDDEEQLQKLASAIHDRLRALAQAKETK